jgi:transcriptional regulator
MTLYNPAHFTVRDEPAVARVLEECGFALLVTTVSGGVHLSHVPVLVESDGDGTRVLVGHLAGANPHAAALATGTHLLVFQGPDGYVSPNWYASPETSVPTWNYVAVHAHGAIERIDDLAGKRAIVDALSARHEAPFPRPWTSSKMEPLLLEKMLGAIVGFRMRVERIEAKFKLSQNRGAADRAGVIAGLEGRGMTSAAELAAWMRNASER